MRGIYLILCTVGIGCVVSVAGQVRAADAPVDKEPVDAPAGTLNLAALWELALTNNPQLREANADVDAARGQVIQAGKYPNPRFRYSEENVGTRDGSPGTLKLELDQEIVTAGKRRLDVAIAHRGMDAAGLALVGRRFDVLTRVRRSYYDYLGWRQTARVYEEVTAALQQGVDITRKQVEDLKTRPRTDLLRLEALQAEAKIGQARSRINVQAGWRQLAAEIGAPDLRPPDGPSEAAVPVPRWDVDAVVQRVLTVHSELMQAGVEIERTRLEVDRARAEALPNVTVTGGYSRDYAEKLMGGVIGLETPLPLWDRKQGKLVEARARLDRAEAVRQTITTRLTRETAEAFARYEAALLQVDRLTTQVLPRLTESLDLVQKGYQAGAAQITFADVLLAEESLNDTRLKQADAKRELWRALADLQGLMQLEVGAELGAGACPP